MSVTPPIVAQVGLSAPLPPGLATVTAPLYPSQTLAWRMRGLFPEQTYDLRLSSHVVKVASVLLGETGAEQVAKRAVYSRLRETMAGSNFLDLDSFWGLIFRLNRGANEQLPVNAATGAPINPYTDVVDSATWQAAYDADSAYRDRLFQFAQAVNYGPSLMGIQAVAEAVLATPCMVFEHYQYTNTPTYSQFPGENLTGMAPLYEVSIIPYTSITVGQLYDLETILNELKPAHAVINVRQMGLAAYNPLTINQAYASSSYWEVEQSVVPTPTSPYATGVVGRWPFAATQGESWSLVSSVVSSSSQAWSATGGFIADSDYQTLRWDDGTYTSYTPDRALLDPWSALAGRLSQTGVTSANPINPSSSPSPVLVDGVDLSSFASALKSVEPQVSSLLDSYWSTPTRLGTDTTVEIASWSFDTDHLVSAVSMQLVNLPHQMTFDHYDQTAASWITDYTQVVLPTSPTVYSNSTSDLSDKVNPAYQFDNAWIVVSFSLPQPVETSRFRVTLSRSVGGYANYPLDYTGSFAPYPLAVAALNVGTVVSDPSMLPVAGEVIDTTRNIFGDQVTFQVYETPPEGAVAASASTWRCSPQPSSSSVVNYYLDCRDGNALAQTFDALWVEPTQLGVNATIYQTTDVPVGVGDLPLRTPLPVTTTGTVSTDTVGLSLSGPNPSVTISASALRFSGSDWWAGISLAGISAGYYTLFSVGSSEVQISQGVVSLLTPEGNLPLAAPVGVGTSATVVVAYLSGQEASEGLGATFGQSLGSYGAVGAVTEPSLYIAVTVGDEIYATLLSVSSPLTVGDVVVGSTDQGAQVTVTDFILKGEPLSVNNLVQFMGSPSAFTFPGPLRGDSAALSVNSWVRFNPQWASSANPVGFVGGTPDATSTMAWTPLLANFTLTTGYVRFEPIAPTFLKIEMTNLVPELISSWTPGLVSTQVMGQSALTPPTEIPSQSQGDLPPGTSTALALAAGESPYRGSTVVASPPPPAGALLPTQALVSSDPSTAQALASAYLQFGYQDWHQASPSVLPVSSPGVESYDSQTLIGSNQFGFFCGFRKISVVRTNPAAAIDTAIMDETFADTANLGPVIPLSAISGTTTTATTVTGVTTTFDSDRSFDAGPTFDTGPVTPAAPEYGSEEEYGSGPEYGD